MDQELPKDVKDFIDGHINSLLQLEVLLFLRNNREEAWEIQALSRELHLATDVTEVHLKDLVVSGLLVTDDLERMYCYKPSTSQLDSAVSQLAHAYAAHPVAVLTRLFSNSQVRVNVFREAFRLIRDDE